MSGPTPARALALALLERLERGREALDELLAAPECEALDARERAFLHELVLGSLRCRGRLDHALAPLVERPLARVDAAVLRLLRLGAHQILNLRVPDRAAVSQSVELARAQAPRAAGFVNAVLRRLSSQGARPLPDREREPLHWLTTAGSLPAWLAERWLARLGPETAVARATALAQPAPVTLRLNPRVPQARERLAAAGVALRELALPGAFVVTAGDPGPLQRGQVVYLQDAGSQLVAHLAAAGGGPLLDACAAPGGKSALIAELLPDELVVAGELSARRRERLARLLRAWGAGGTPVVGADALRPPFRRPFATVLLDAPCSGLGTLARHPDIRWRAQPDDLPRQARRQAALLRSLAGHVRPGGRLVYAVCSLEPEETTEVVEAFLAEHDGFEACAPEGWAAPWRSGDAAVTLPERDPGDGFYAAVLRRAPL